MLVVLAPDHVWAQGSWNPEEASVPWTGAPAPVEGRTSGGALSPHGSHVGLKAVLDEDADRVGGGLAAVAIHDARASRLGRLTIGSIVLRDAFGALLPAAEAEVAFEPWGWTATSTAGQAGATVRVTFVAEDAVLLAVRLEDQSGDARDVTVDLQIAGGEATSDGTGALVALGDATLAAGAAEGLVIPEPGPPARVRIAAIDLPARGSATSHVMLGFGADADEARRARDRGFVAFASRDPDEAWQAQADAFAAVEASAACSDLDGSEAEAVHRLATAALWSSGYAARGALTRALLSAAKGRDNAFLGSDLPAQAVGVSSWDPEAGLAALLGQIDAIADDSHVPYRFDDELVRAPLPNGSMPPVQAQAIAAAMRWGATLDDDERARVVRRLEGVAAWWPTNRDYRRAGLLVHGSPEEAGRPGSLRWPVVDGESEAAYFEAPDLAATFVEFLAALADLEEGVPDGDPETLRELAEEVAKQLHSDLYDGDRGAWLDLDTRTTEPSAVVGPFAISPLAAGLVHDPDVVTRALDEVLLAPDVLWGDDDGPRLPIPSLSHDTPVVDDAARPTYVEDVAMALRALSRYGRTEEATVLEERVLALVAARREGLYDRYHAGAAPEDLPPALQAGRAAAELLSILHRDHERERWVFAEETRIEGRIGVARFLEGGRSRIVDLGARARLPRLVLESVDPEAPLEDLGALRLTLAPSCDVPAGEVVDVELPALGPFRWFAEDGGESGRATGALAAEVGRSYRLEPLSLRGGGCSCRTSAAPTTTAWGAALLAFVLVSRRAARGCASTRRSPTARRRSWRRSGGEGCPADRRRSG